MKDDIFSSVLASRTCLKVPYITSERLWGTDPEDTRSSSGSTNWSSRSCWPKIQQNHRRKRAQWQKERNLCLDLGWLVGYLGSIRAPYSSEGGSAEDNLKGGEEGQEKMAELFIAAQQFHTQGDASMPLPREDTKVSSVDWRIKDVLLVDIVIAVSRKNLKGKTS